MAQQTAVDLLISELTKYGYIIAPSFGHAIIDELIKKAKEMEKQEKARCWIASSNYALKIINTDEKPNFKAAFEQYYNETYKKD